MLTNQQFFDKACNSLNNNGSHYGHPIIRGWGWVNPNNPRERCAVAQFIAGNNDCEVTCNLSQELGTKWIYNQLIHEIKNLYDLSAFKVNNKQLLDKELSKLADKYSLKYTSILPESKLNDSLMVLDTLETIV